MSVELPTIDDHDRLVAQVATLATVVADLANLVRSTTNPPRLLKLSEAPAYTGLPRSTISKLIAAGDLEYHVIEGSKRLLRDDLDEFIAARTGRAATEVRPLRSVG